jgi:2-polyprenyl-3-methyl-5-hydroxy-6-metoxy-1,4-benzoquinol methylase
MNYQYPGEELELFAHAVNWKTYWHSKVREFIVGDVLEAGAGIGATTRVLCDGRQTSWTCLEPDPQLADTLARNLNEAPLPITPRAVIGQISDLSADSRFDTILYIDVLEHIDDDRGEMNRAAALLKPGGTIVVLCPAHQWLYSPFDRSIGHFRRYNRRLFRQLTPPGARLEKLLYLDSAGLIVSSANRVLLRQAKPTLQQVQLWDRVFVNVSRRLDSILGWRVGKSVLGVWRRRSS